MTQEQADKIDVSLIRELKQQFISHNLLPHEFTFTQFDLGKLKVTCKYGEFSNPHAFTIELI